MEQLENDWQGDTADESHESHESHESRESQDIAGRPRGAASRAREKVSDAVEGARGRAGDLQATLADRLEASGMERQAMWLRENDLTELGELLERELREHPGRTALVALGLGFLLGRASRR